MDGLGSVDAEWFAAFDAEAAGDEWSVFLSVPNAWTGSFPDPWDFDYMSGDGEWGMQGGKDVEPAALLPLDRGQLSVENADTDDGYSLPHTLDTEDRCADNEALNLEGDALFDALDEAWEAISAALADAVSAVF